METTSIWVVLASAQATDPKQKQQQQKKTFELDKR